jgi:hypothetical protein
MINTDPKEYHWSDEYVPYHYKDGNITGKTYTARKVLRQSIDAVVNKGVSEESIQDLMQLAYEAGKDIEAEANAEREAGASL